MSKSKQEGLWRGDFGDAYTGRNAVDDGRLSALTAHWARVLRGTVGLPPKSIAEVGANIGLNLRALRRLTAAEFYAVEPNAVARKRLVDDAVLPAKNIFDGLASALPFPDDSIDLVFTSGVLIHVHPKDLATSCGEIHRVARHYLVCIEYFSDKEEEILYRGKSEALFKRDFGSFYLDQFPNLRVLDYGFAWKQLTGLDNLTWWLFDKAA